MEEYVVLVDEHNIQIGTAPKHDVHTHDTPLHRGFSLFLFNSKKELLVTRRAISKKTFPGVWTNTVCGHPGVDESAVDAAKRRLKDELGLTVVDVKEIALYRYTFADSNGIVENEICPILVAYLDIDPIPRATEVAEWRWMKWTEFLDDTQKNPDNYSPWCREEAQILDPIL